MMLNAPAEWESYLPTYHHDVVPASPQALANTKAQPKEALQEKESKAHDLTMETVSKQLRKLLIKDVCINHFEIIDDSYVVYKIEVYRENCSWVVSRRYREFHRLHEELVQHYTINWELLPPKKIVGNMKPSNIAKRKLLLEKYLKNVLGLLSDIPRVLIEFLEMDQFDVNTVCRQLSRDLYEIGDELLRKKSIFKITPLQIHCINRRLQLPLPTCETDNPAEDIGHLYSFIQQVKYILIHRGYDDHMYISDSDLNYDLSIFKSLLYLEVQQVDIELMTGIDIVQTTLREVRAQRCLQLLKDFLISSESWAQGLLMTVKSDQEDHTNIVSQFTKWKKITRASFSYNNFHSIDYSIMLLPNITVLDLSHNLLTEVQYLEELTFLTELNLSYNEIRHLADFPFRIPSVSKLNLAGNGIQNIQGLERMYSLVQLDISNNQLHDVSDVLKLGNLPMLMHLKVVGNPLTNIYNYRIRILVQFGFRGTEIKLDGIDSSKKEAARIMELVASHENYDIISDDVVSKPYTSTPPQSATQNLQQNTDAGSPHVVKEKLTHQLAATNKAPMRSPRIKKKLAAINPPKDSNKAAASNLATLENEEENFRNKIEKLRHEAGDNWLTFYNDMIEKDESDQIDIDEEYKSHTEEKDSIVHEVSTKTEQSSASVPTVKVTTDDSTDGKHKEIQVNGNKAEDVGIDTQQTTHQKQFIRSLSYNEIDLELTDDMRAAVKDLINRNVDLVNETFLVVGGDVSKDDIIEEHMVAIDSDAYTLVEINLNTGTTIATYDLRSIRGLKVEFSKGTFILQFEAVERNKNNKESVRNSCVFQLVRLVTRAVKEAAGLYAVIKSFNNEVGTKSFRSYSQNSGIIDISKDLSDNPFEISSEILRSFFQDFMRKSKSQKRSSSTHSNASSKNNTDTTPVVNTLQREISTNYENIDIGLSFYQHDLTQSSKQDIVTILWLGCLPYLFPDEEIPVCVVLTTANLFLFRIFIPESDREGKSLRHLNGLQEAMHCFYSFPLKDIREIVVGLFDQGFRIEVSDEGPRGTFLFLTRDANKTAKFLDALASIFGFKSERELADAKAKSSDNEKKLASLSSFPSIIYPDESNINALKIQLQEQQLQPLDNRENLISYSIVYEHRETDNGIDSYDESSIPYLHSLILTNQRLLLCDEDYVHWPLPSFVRSAPLTPQWIVDDIDKIDNIIGIDIWEDMRGKQSMTGCYGVTISFEKGETESVNLSNMWNLLFQSMAEREQFVRSLACLWKNSFDQDLKVTYSKNPFYDLKKHSGSLGFIKGHHKKPSGSNISIAPSQCLDSPEMFVVLDRSRLNDIFRNKIACGDDHSTSGVQYVTCIVCKPFKYPELEIPVALLLGRHYIYLICSTQHHKYIVADTVITDDGAVHSLHVNAIKISDLRQVIVGLFDQCFRLETEDPEETFVCVTRNFDRTNDFIQRLSQVILSLPQESEEPNDKQPVTVKGGINISLPENKLLSTSQGSVPSQPRSMSEIFKMYKQEDEDENSGSFSEFIHPNSNIKFIYPSDDTLAKLKYRITDYIKNKDSLPTIDSEIGILLYALIYQCNSAENIPYTFIVSERFVCLINEDHVNYPLPLFVKELPMSSQYTIISVQLIASILYIEFDDFHSGFFTLVFNKNAVDPNMYERRFSVVDDNDACLVTDLNKRENIKDTISWNLKAYSHIEREKIFSILSKMWNMIYTGSTLPIHKKKKDCNTVAM